MKWLLFASLVLVQDLVISDDFTLRLAEMEKKLQVQENKIKLLESRTCQSKRQTVAASVAFSVRLRQDLLNLSSGYVLVFDEVKLNQGTGYNSSTGVFTCPEQGLYLFTWTLESMRNGRAGACLVVNGKMRQSTLADTNPNHYQSSSGSEIAMLNVGDDVFLMTCQELSSVDDVESYLTGALIGA